MPVKNKEKDKVDKGDGNETIVNDIIKEINYIISARQPIDNKWQIVNDRMEGKLGKSKGVWQSKKFIHLVSTATQTVAYNLAGGAVDFDEISGEGETDVDRGQIGRDWIQHEWKGSWGMRDKLLSCAQQSVAFNVGWMKFPWVVDMEDGSTDSAVKLDKETINPKQVNYIGVRPMVVDLENILVDPYEPDFDRLNSLVHINYPTLGELKRNKGYGNLDKLYEEMFGGKGVDMATGMDKNYTQSTTDSPDDMKRVCVAEHWTRSYITTIALPNVGKVDEIGSFNASGVMLRRMKNRYKMLPFSALRVETAVRSRFYPDNMITRSLSVQDGVNSCVNQMFDNIALRMSPMLRTGNKDTQKRITAAPGRVISLKEPEKAEWFVTPDTTDAGKWALNFLLSRWNVATLGGDMMRGQGNSGADFAVEASRQMSSLDMIYDVGERAIEEFVQRSVRIIVKVYQEHLDDIEKMGMTEKVFSMFDTRLPKYKGIVEIIRSINPDVDLRIKAGSVKRVDKAVQLTRMREALSDIGRNPVLAQKFDLEKAYKDFFTKAGVDEINQHFRDKETLDAQAVMAQDKEARIMMRGIPAEPADHGENHRIHKMTLDHIQQSAEYKNAVARIPGIEQLFTSHRQSHDVMEGKEAQEAQIQASQPVPPQNTPPSGPVTPNLPPQGGIGMNEANVATGAMNASYRA